MPHYDKGLYQVEITNQGLNKSSQKGTPGFFLRILPEGGAYERDIQWWITEKTVEYVIRDLRSLGFAGKSFGELDLRRKGFHNFIGMEIKAACTHEENGDKVYERWGLPFGGADITPLGTAEAHELDSLFGDQLQSQDDEYNEPERRGQAPVEEAPWEKDAAKEATEKLAADAANLPPGAPDDDIPF